MVSGSSGSSTAALVLHKNGCKSLQSNALFTVSSADVAQVMNTCAVETSRSRMGCLKPMGQTCPSFVERTPVHWTADVEQHSLRGRGGLTKCADTDAAIPWEWAAKRAPGVSVEGHTQAWTRLDVDLGKIRSCCVPFSQEVMLLHDFTGISMTGRCLAWVVSQNVDP